MEWSAEDGEMIAYIQRRLHRPWGGFEYSQVQWLLDKLLEARQELQAKTETTGRWKPGWTYW